jgi:UDP-N-acetylglucosamine--N-acetylmuramyl-(pentapeptide) pyrophosphoryl-undecaprenol N-acetylglucosamine transferase
MSQTKTLMVMAGGTGGHVYPAIAVADMLKVQGWKIVWLATQGGMENRLIDGKGYQKAMIHMQGVRGKGLLGWMLLPIKLLKAFIESYQAIQHYQPNVVLGMGGFAAFPGGVMAKLLGKPLVIHEQNSVAGLTNKVMAKLASRVLAAFPNVLSKANVVGNPVREEITKLLKPEARFKTRKGPLRILVVGGSLGAQALNELIPKAIAKIPKKDRPVIIHQAGAKHLDGLKAAYQKHDVEADCLAFIENIDEMYAWADFVICRAGAMTVAELSVVGLGSLLVPFPFAVDDHQTTNAGYLAESCAAFLEQQKTLTVTKLVQILNQLNRNVCLEMAQRAQALGKPNATSDVANVCMETAI